MMNEEALETVEKTRKWMKTAWGIDAPLEPIITAIKELVQTKPKGMWLNEFGGDYRCSKCHKIIELGVNGKMNITQFYYCPNCGSYNGGKKMKLMIDISEELYAKVPTLINSGNIWIGDVLDAVKNGTPLPKGHGRLIDADAYKSEINRIFPCQSADDKNIRRATEIGIDNAPTIIEADGGGADGK